MAAADVVLATDEVGGKTGSRTSKQRKRKRALVVKRARTGGVGRLFDEADKLVGESAGELANLFKEAALKGHIASTKMLVDLAVRKKPRAAPVKKKPQGMTLAQRWMEDLREHGEWKGEQEEGFAEVGEGGLEPENLE
jgi:hypothetical protein